MSTTNTKTTQAAVSAHPECSTTRDFAQFKILLFDCYGTLVDSDKGISDALNADAHTCMSSAAREGAVQAFKSVLRDVHARFPTLRFASLLARAHEELHARLKGSPPPSHPNAPESVVVEAKGARGTADITRAEAGTSAGTSAQTPGIDAHTVFARSLARWPLFPDTRPALIALGTHFRIVVATAADRDSFAPTRQRLEEAMGTEFFAAVYTAEDGTAQEILRKTEAIIGVPKSDVIFVCGEEGLGGASLMFDTEESARRVCVGKDGENNAGRYATLEEMVDAMNAE